MGVEVTLGAPEDSMASFGDGDRILILVLKDLMFFFHLQLDRIYANRRFFLIFSLSKEVLRRKF